MSWYVGKPAFQMSLRGRAPPQMMQLLSSMSSLHYLFRSNDSNHVFSAYVDNISNQTLNGNFSVSHEKM